MSWRADAAGLTSKEMERLDQSLDVIDGLTSKRIDFFDDEVLSGITFVVPATWVHHILMGGSDIRSKGVTDRHVAEIARILRELENSDEGAAAVESLVRIRDDVSTKEPRKRRREPR